MSDVKTLRPDRRSKCADVRRPSSAEQDHCRAMAQIDALTRQVADLSSACARPKRCAPRRHHEPRRIIEMVAI